MSVVTCEITYNFVGKCHCTNHDLCIDCCLDNEN